MHGGFSIGWPTKSSSIQTKRFEAYATRQVVFFGLLGSSDTAMGQMDACYRDPCRALVGCMQAIGQQQLAAVVPAERMETQQ